MNGISRTTKKKITDFSRKLTFESARSEIRSESIYNETLAGLRCESVLEYLDDQELDDAFHHFTCKIIENKQIYKKDLEKLSQEIEAFFNSISKQLEEYEVLIPILNLDANDSKFRIRDITIKKIGKKSLEEFGLKKEYENILFGNFFEKTVDKTVAIIPEKGNNPKLVCERARKKADYAIRVLQVALAISSLHHLALLFKQDVIIYYRIKNNPSSVRGYWQRGYKPLGLEINADYENRINEFLSNTQVIIEKQKPSPELEKCFEKALTWIGRSIEEEDLDIKIVKLSIALETILTTKDDRLKGEALTSRMLFLNDIVQNQPFKNPAEVLRIYVLRSKIVHSGELGIASQEDYLTMLQVAIETLVYSIDVTKGLRNQNDFIGILDSHSGKEKIIEYLKKHGDKSDKMLPNLIKYMESIGFLKKPQSAVVQ
nr:MAG: HEPN domain-containing protein [Candidatus Methanoperedens sp.]